MSCTSAVPVLRPWKGPNYRHRGGILFGTTMWSSTFVSLAVFFAAFAVTTIAQSSTSRLPTSLPTQGVQLSSAADIRFPVTVSQCERVVIYHNTPDSDGLDFYTVTPSGSSYFLTLHIPFGIGYLEWICNIPAGYTVVVESHYDYVFVVQPGPSSCLGELTTTYDYASYRTTLFRSFTGYPPNTTAPTIATNSTARVSASFRTGEFTTITANPGLAVASSLQSSVRPSSTTSTQPKSKTAAIAGAVAGAAAVVILALVVALVWTCRRYGRRTNIQLEDFPNSPATQSMRNSQAPILQNSQAALNPNSHAPWSLYPQLDAPSAPHVRGSSDNPGFSSRTALNTANQMDTHAAVFNNLAPPEGPPGGVPSTIVRGPHIQAGY